jgi:hypothetical protein
MKPDFVNRFLREKGNSLSCSTEIRGIEGKNHTKVVAENYEGAGESTTILSKSVGFEPKV